ncbi:MAG: polysaccharide deacetylase [Blautia sp.]|nr:polysaccharide deacetylase [Blautia sp.]MCM1201216.1 polysaccharide deacetylase [Bacteroides fragilis]
MAQTEEKRRPMSKDERRFLRKIIIFFLVIATPVLAVLCIFLGIRLHIVRTELEKLQAQAVEAAFFGQPGDSEGLAEAAEPDAGKNTGDPVDAGTEEYADRYSADGVSVSKRDSAGLPAAYAEEGAVPEDGAVRKVYLTFDDGPSSNTARILDILAEYDVKATFFVVGKEEEQYQALYKRIVDEGHTLGMHSYSHKYDEIYQSVDSYAQDMSRLQEFLYETTGVWCRYCRFPGGSSNMVSGVDMYDLIAYLDEQDITYFDWNVSSGDASNSYISKEAIISNCISTLPQYQESIILMHDASNKNTTVEALPDLIEQIQAMENTVIVPITEDTEPIQHISSD